MKALLDKLTSYNVFNYLLPGVLFATAGTNLTSYTLLMDDTVAGFFVYYFYGLTISLLGSLTLEPVFRWTGFVRFAPYEDFQIAARNDEKLEVLSEQNNMCRTFSTMLLCLLFLLAVDFVARQSTPLFPPVFVSVLSMFLLFLLFSFSYRKQTQYIRSRVLLSVRETHSDVPEERKAEK